MWTSIIIKAGRAARMLGRFFDILGSGRAMKADRVARAKVIAGMVLDENG